MDKLFFEKVFAKEQDKMIYYFLVYPQQTVLIKVGEKQAEKDFIGYEFSSRRGHEGIKMFRDESGKPTTKLYDEENPLNPEKANSYVYRSFLNKKFVIEKSLATNITTFDTLELMDFTKLAFEKSISLSVKKKVDFNSFWEIKNLVLLSSIANIQKGTSITKADTVEGNVPVVAGGKEAAYYHNVSNRNAPVITVSASGAYSGFINYWDQPIFASDCNTIVSKSEKEISTKLIFLFLKLMQEYFYMMQRGQAQPHVYASDIEKVKIPLPPKPVQEKIIKEISAVEQREKAGSMKVDDLKRKRQDTINTVIKECETTSISKIGEVKGGKRVPKGYKLLSTKTDYPYIRVADFKNGSVSFDNLKYIDEATFNKISRYTINSDDVYISIAGTIGLVGTIPKVLNGKSLTENAAKIVITDKSRYDYRFLYYVLTSEFAQEQISERTRAVGVPKLTIKRIETILIPKIDIKEQNNIIEKIDKIEAEIKVLEANLANIDKEKEQILKKRECKINSV